MPAHQQRLASIDAQDGLRALFRLQLHVAQQTRRLAEVDAVGELHRLDRDGPHRFLLDKRRFEFLGFSGHDLGKVRRILDEIGSAPGFLAMVFSISGLTSLPIPTVEMVMC